MESNMRKICASFAFILSIVSAQRMSDLDRQMTVERRVNGEVVFGTSNDIVPGMEKPIPVVKMEEKLEDKEVGSLQALDKMEPGFIDSVFGNGGQSVQSRIVESLNNWVVDKAKTNPGCVERFVCETYRTGETLSGIPYILMSMTNAAVSFYVAEMFDKSIDIKEITRAARYGRTVGSCHQMECEVINGQLRTLGDYLGGIEEFFSDIFNSISNSISIFKKK